VVSHQERQTPVVPLRKGDNSECCSLHSCGRGTACRAPTLAEDAQVTDPTGSAGVSFGGLTQVHPSDLLGRAAGSRSGSKGRPPAMERPGNGKRRVTARRLPGEEWGGSLG